MLPLRIFLTCKQRAQQGQCQKQHPHRYTCSGHGEGHKPGRQLLHKSQKGGAELEA
jgi:hypothetical protein